MARLLIMSASAGAGHNRAAEAIQASAAEYFPGHPAEWTDSLKFTSRLFRKLYSESYIWMANHSPLLYGILYEASGQKIEPKTDRLIRMFDRVAYRKLIEHVDEFAPDAVICTHFLPTNVVLLHRGQTLPVYVVVTDFDVHAAWVRRGVAGYFVASEEVAWRLAGFGIPRERIHVTGIPIHPVFSKPNGSARRELGLRRDVPVVTLMSGGFGIGHIDEAVDRVAALPGDFEFVVICGKNEKLRQKLARKKRVKAHGFVTNIQLFMEASDVVVTKSGGLTVSECLAKGAPMIIFSPIPGQEERNCDFLLERGAAIKATSLDVLDFKVKELLEAPDRLSKMKKAAEAAARPFAGRDVLKHIVGNR